MAIVMCAVKVINRFKPHILMILLQICVASVYFLTEASFNQGLNAHIYVTYRHAAGSLVMFPFAYFLERCATHTTSNIQLLLLPTSTHCYICLVLFLLLLFFSFLFACRKIRPKLTLALFLEMFLLSRGAAKFHFSSYCKSS